MRLHTSILCALLAPLAVAGAQTSEGDARAWVALDATHIGAMTPLLTPSMIGRQLNGAQLGIRYGFSSQDNVTRHVIGGSATFGMGTSSSLSITAGAGNSDCNGCAAEPMVGVGGDMRIYQSGDVLGAGTLFDLGVSGDFGWAKLKPSDVSAYALGIGMPVALTMTGNGTTGMRIVPFLTPVFGIGQLSSNCLTVNCQNSGTRWVLGGGVGLWNPMTSISASLGFNKVFLEGAPTTWGVNVSFGGR